MATNQPNSEPTFEVINVHPEAAIAFEKVTLRVEELQQRSNSTINQLAHYFHQQMSNNGRLMKGKYQDWITQGIECQVLEPQSEGWRPRKIKLSITLEFCDEAEPAAEEITVSEKPKDFLDELRQMSN